MAGRVAPLAVLMLISNASVDEYQRGRQKLQMIRMMWWRVLAGDSLVPLTQKATQILGHLRRCSTSEIIRSHIMRLVSTLLVVASASVALGQSPFDSLHFRSIGPAATGGRVHDIEVDPKDP